MTSKEQQAIALVRRMAEMPPAPGGFAAGNPFGELHDDAKALAARIGADSEHSANSRWMIRAAAQLLLRLPLALAGAVFLTQAFPAMTTDTFWHTFCALFGAWLVLFSLAPP